MSKLSFPEWLKRPQMLVALSALLLSVCGLFIAIYEATLIRQTQHASVWPHVEVGASTSQEHVSIWAQNTGVGPARIQAAALTYKGETVKNWEELLRRVVGGPVEIHAYLSLISGRVMPADSEHEIMFKWTQDDEPIPPEALSKLRREVRGTEIDVILCYCSVYDQCWTSSLQDAWERLRDVETARGTREVDDCEAAMRSAI